MLAHIGDRHTIGGAIAPEKVVRLFHGLRLGYANYEDVGSRLIPTISVMPTILLRSETGSWIYVARRQDVHQLPYEYAELGVTSAESSCCSSDLARPSPSTVGPRARARAS